MISEKLITENNWGKNISNASDYHLNPRFRWYGYKEGFSPNLVKETIDCVGVGDKEYIIDPFNGSGTVTLTSAMHNVNSLGIEVNPFVAFMSRVKLENFDRTLFCNDIDRILSAANKGYFSPLSQYSTFSERTGKGKWLFNSGVLDSFHGAWKLTDGFSDIKKRLFQLSLIGAAMDNCNAVKDGKCLKYRVNWQNRSFDKNSFIQSTENRLVQIGEDLDILKLENKALILNEDARQIIRSLPGKFKLCITSPPYLNSFDYTDIYRPELFLGGFVSSSEELRKLRYQTVRSHVEIKLPLPIENSFGEIYESKYKAIHSSKDIWSKQIPTMIQCYFEDMQNVLHDLYKQASSGAELWMVVANSVYVGVELPVDLILAEIGTKQKWKLKKIEVMRYIYRRKTKYSGGIDKVRESLIVFEKKITCPIQSLHSLSHY